MRRILIVDDELDITEALKDLLEPDGYMVVTAPNGQVGLKMVADHRPDVVLLDVMMPVMTGPEMLERLRASSPELPVIMMSAGGHHEIADALGVRFLKKPFGVRMLRSVLDQVLAPQ